jgi:lysophospholipase L1-like esterase
MKEAVREAAQYNPYTNIDIYGDQVKAAQQFSDDLKKLRLAYRPYVERRRIPNQHLNNIHINKWGYRGPDFTFDKGDDVFRIIIFGGSFVWGTGAIYDEETIAGHLQRMLNENYKEKKFEVINGGETGYVLTQERILFVEEGIFFSPDLVIFLDGINNLWVVYKNLPAGFPGHYEAYNKRLSVDYRKPVGETLRGQMTFLSNQNSATRKSLYRISIIDTVKSLFDYRSRDSLLSWKLSSRHLHNAVIIKAICEGQNITCVFGFQPILYLGKPWSRVEERIVEYSKKRYPGFYGLVGDVYPRYRDLVVMGMRKHGIHFFDLINIFDKDLSTRYVDAFHLTGEGYGIVAERLLEFMKKENMLN